MSDATDPRIDPPAGPDVLAEFFSAAQERAAFMRPPERMYRHRLVDELPGLLDQLRVQSRLSAGSTDECMRLLIEISATCGRNYRLAVLLKGTAGAL